ncbi:5-methyltetrahydropteroyltriglutamate--homocysteine S-methyltransferase [Timonella senegalensis]|uniref:5-methyltetrahydropteroyltriglutamate-- homocysteine S-methyltransferase n=1 Tax=Timonella senegalensis TaxID=1465825 RepID=UPI0028A9A29A|nr:5-methyltetrahydropteroyltriglutamate--homocysteine S-methyltransferase [Timonella senegalensis]
MSTALPFPRASVLGYPRIGNQRQLKRAVESYWSGKSSLEDLTETAAQLRRDTRSRLVELGLGKDDASIPESFSFYDQVLDAIAAFGAVPARFASLLDDSGRLDLPGYFTVARGKGEDAPLEMTKWFDTNYHYLVPELGPDSAFSLVGTQYVDQFNEAKADGFVTRPVVVGPVTFLALSKAAEGAPANFNPLTLLPALVPAYVSLLEQLAEAGAPWVQFDEPALVNENLAASGQELREAVASAYETLLATANRPQIAIAAPYGGLEESFAAVAATGVEAIAIDLVKGSLPDATGIDLSGTTIAAGVIDGHNIWRANLSDKLAILERAEGLGAAAVTVTTSTSLQHVPYTLDAEAKLDAELKTWLAFAEEKTREVVTLARGLAEGRGAIEELVTDSRTALDRRESAPGVNVAEVRAATAALTATDFDREDAEERRAAQATRLNLPPLPTTTIGSFPQTTAIRKARAANARGELATEGYEQAMRDEIAQVIALQEELGLDVLVHGEAERNDMVQYFAELLDGFAATENGWVQSYGSRCTRPSIQWGDVSRPAPMTVRWAEFAQSLTRKPVKGMLTGPVTIMAWSFVRDDVPLRETANQIGLALRAEVNDLEAAGIAAIQVDEPALRELLPLKKRDHADYLDWSVGSFRLSTAGVRVDTQIHTHLCYSEFGEVIDAIDNLNADVTSIEAARSRMEILPELADAGYSRGVGPGVYDIHSPRVPSVGEIQELLELAVKSVDPTLLWSNPDCGLKTRGYDETVASLRNLVEATVAVRVQQSEA